jgi:hypothetical protein
MLFDKELVLSDAQAITVTAVSTNTHDNHGADLGRGEPMQVTFLITESFAATGAGTLTISLLTDDNTGFSSAQTVWTSTALALAALTAGTFIYAALPPGVERYLRANYGVGTGPMTAGKITAAVSPRMREDSAKFYPQAAVANA